MTLFSRAGWCVYLFRLSVAVLVGVPGALFARVSVFPVLVALVCWDCPYVVLKLSQLGGCKGGMFLTGGCYPGPPGDFRPKPVGPACWPSLLASPTALSVAGF